MEFIIYDVQNLFRYDEIANSACVLCSRFQRKSEFRISDEWASIVPFYVLIDFVLIELAQ